MEHYVAIMEKVGFEVQCEVRLLLKNLEIFDFLSKNLDFTFKILDLRLKSVDFIL